MNYDGTASKFRRVLPDQSTDPRVLRDAFALGGVGEGRLLPYAGTSARANHAYARLLADAATASDSRAACHHDLVAYVTGDGTFGARHRDRSGFARAAVPVELSAAEVEAYGEAVVALGITGEDLRRASADLLREALRTGWGALLFDVVRVGGARRASVRAVGLDHAILWRPDAPAGHDRVVYFPDGTRDIRASSRAYAYACVASAAEAREVLGEPGPRGARVALCLTVGRGPYGRPGDEAALPYALAEAAWAAHDEIAAATVTTARAMVAYPMPESLERQRPGDAGQSPTAADEVAEAVASARANMRAHDVAFLGYSGSNPPELLKLDLARDAKYRAVMERICVQKIYAANRWSPQLSGHTDAPGGLGSDQFRRLVAFKHATVVRPWQRRLEVVLGEGLAFALGEGSPHADTVPAFHDPLAFAALGFDPAGGAAGAHAEPDPT